MSAARRLIPVAILFLLLVWQGEFALRVLRSDMDFFQIQRGMVFWGSGEARPSQEQVDAMAFRVDATVALWNTHPDYLAMQARIVAWQAVLASGAERSAYIEEAARLMSLSLAIRPANPYSWAQYAEYLRALPGQEAELDVAASKAMNLAPGDFALTERMRALLIR